MRRAENTARRETRGPAEGVHPCQSSGSRKNPIPKPFLIQAREFEVHRLLTRAPDHMTDFLVLNASGVSSLALTGGALYLFCRTASHVKTASGVVSHGVRLRKRDRENRVNSLFICATYPYTGTNFGTAQNSSTCDNLFL